MKKIGPNRTRNALTRRSLLQTSGAAALAVSGGGILSACGSDDADADSGQLTFLNVLPMTSLTFAAEMFADAAGYFADLGLNVEFQVTRGSAQAIQLVLAGGAEVTRVGQIEAISHASNRQAPIVNVATVVKESTLRLVSSSAAPLREPSDLIDKLIGIPSEGGESETTLDLLIGSAGIDPDRVSRQVVGLGPGVFELVERGRLAGFIVSIDTANILESQSDNVEVLRPAEFIESGDQLYMLAQDDYERLSDPIGRFLNSIRSAIDFIAADDGFEETLRILRQKYSFGTLDNTEVAKRSLAEYVQAWTAQGEENILRTQATRWAAGYEELVRVGQATAGQNPENWFTNDLVPNR